VIACAALLVVVAAAAVVPQFMSTARGTQPPGPAPEGMVWVPGGTFWMGDAEFEDASPIHRVEVDGFWMDGPR
jgi:formylglycine-generating enzyme required for sulfatase activity